MELFTSAQQAETHNYAPGVLYECSVELQNLEVIIRCHVPWPANYGLFCLLEHCVGGLPAEIQIRRFIEGTIWIL